MGAPGTRVGTNPTGWLANSASAVGVAALCPDMLQTEGLSVWIERAQASVNPNNAARAIQIRVILGRIGSVFMSWN